MFHRAKEPTASTLRHKTFRHFVVCPLNFVPRVLSLLWESTLGTRLATADKLADEARVNLGGGVEVGKGVAKEKAAGKNKLN